ncbi:hypothetical protein M0R45_027349 [Rubus argutus]|uniref:Uncharacterized protein n=1 Tax=Rubus argutus TaxID=59490 RepID=A0AAW1X1V1_RUBAR
MNLISIQSSSMDCRPLEIRLFSANDIKDINLFSKMDVYAVVSISSGLRSRSSGPRSTRTATPTPNGTTPSNSC